MVINGSQDGQKEKKGDATPDDKDGGMTTISVPESLRDRLGKLKVHRNQPYYEVVQKLVDKHFDQLESGGEKEDDY